MNQACVRCGGQRVLQGARVVADAFLGGPVRLAGVAASGVSAAVCVDCGHIELSAVDLAKLRVAYGEHQSLDLNASPSR